jgi:hypothetical protein
LDSGSFTPQVASRYRRAMLATSCMVRRNFSRKLS